MEIHELIIEMKLLERSLTLYEEVYVHIEKVAPQVSRLVNPRLEIEAA